VLTQKWPMRSRVRSSSHLTFGRPRPVARTWRRQPGPAELPNTPGEDERFTATSGRPLWRMHSVLFETHTVRRSPGCPLVALAFTGLKMVRFAAARCRVRTTPRIRDAFPLQSPTGTPR